MGNISPKIWDDKKFKAIKTLLGKVLFLNALTRDQPLPGLLKVSYAGLADDLDQPEDVAAIRAAMDNLIDLELIQYDHEFRLLRVPKAPLYNAPGNHNVLRGWYRKWCTLPESPLRLEHVVSMAESMARLIDSAALEGDDRKAYGWQSTWDSTFGLARVPTSGRHLRLVSAELNDSQNGTRNRLLNSWQNRSRSDARSDEIRSPEQGSEIRDPLQTGERPELAVVNGSGTPPAAAAPGDVVQELWARQNVLRRQASPLAKNLPLTNKARDAVLDILKKYSREDCLHVLEVYAQEAIRKRKIDWFDGTTNWKERNFANALGKDVEVNTPREMKRAEKAFGEKPRKVDLS
jgi:hypothetical protein